ncbi:HD domain-containing protein [Patescibacteria group bacterium]|nr:HD domain-containing protein [Patescibacteria group bacterium]
MIIKELSRDQRKLIEEYTNQEMTVEIGHDTMHALRACNWALKIAKGEKFNRLDMVEVAALLHDVGLKEVIDRREHGRAGAKKAIQFLKEQRMFTGKEREEIGYAIQLHNSNKKGKSLLADILRDADIMELMGAVGIMRGIAAHHAKPFYNPNNVKGELWEASAKVFDERIRTGKGKGNTIVDSLNFHISCFENIGTKTGEKLAKPLTDYVRGFILELEKEVKK